MNINKAILERFSCRTYKSKKISNKDLNKILNAAINSPNAGNLQAWKFVVVDKEDIKERITKAALDQQWMMQAPLFIIVCSDLKKLKTYYPNKYKLYAIQDTAISAENMMLMAFSLNIKSCFIGAFDEKAIKRILRLPDDVEAYCIITLGYSNEKKAIKRLSMDYSVKFNQY
jgi:nitroreductase